jgi:hypothetical protein
MLLNLQTEYARLQLGEEKMYGLWGFHHVLQSAVNKSRPLAALVRSSSLPFRNRVVSLAIFSTDSETMIPAGSIPPAMRPAERTVSVGWLNSAGPVVLVPGVSDLLEAAPASAPATLFRLDAPGAPYRHSLQLTNVRAPLMGQSMEATRAGSATTDYFQYAILLRHSAAVKPLATTLPVVTSTAQ